MRLDLHCHTCYSGDSLTQLDGLLRWMDRRGLDMVAITDHNTLDGARDFCRKAPDRLLMGEEIRTTEGEVLALFVEEHVPPDLSLQETLDRVHAQDGLVGASHPLDRFRDVAMGRRTLETVRGRLDFVEVLNARVIVHGDNRLARELAIRWGLAGSAGSDAHAAFEVGRAYVEMPRFGGRHDFVDCLAQAQIGGGASSPLVHFVSTYAKWRKRLGLF
jgi:predicted metal-dependent phosphoesterase TrpH